MHLFRLKIKLKWNTAIILYITINAQWNNVTKTVLVKPEKGSVERIIDHAGRDSNSYVYKHCMETGHRSPDISDFKIIGSNFRKNVFERKIVEALLIKQLKPTLNKQEKSIELKPFNWHHVYAGFSALSSGGKLFWWGDSFRKFSSGKLGDLRKIVRLRWNFLTRRLGWKILHLQFWDLFSQK